MLLAKSLRAYVQQDTAVVHHFIADGFRGVEGLSAALE